MKILNERYIKIFIHKGFDICTLKEANPAKGDRMGFVVDHECFRSTDFNHVDDAIKAIDSYLLKEQ